MMYSLESFLFHRLNLGSREQDTSIILTLGPFAVALSKVINNIQKNRADKIIGPFVCYSGMALDQELIESWKGKKKIVIEGYRSTSLDLGVARTFAARNETDKLDQVVLAIEMENKSGLYYICLDRHDYSVYPDEKEILLEAGLIAEVKSFVEIEDNHGKLTMFNLHISDKMVKKYKMRRQLVLIVPLIFICLK